MFHFEKNFGLFIGRLSVNEYHKHYALQISVSENEDLNLNIFGEMEQVSSSFYISSNVVHKLLSTETHLTILVNPLSPLGHYLYLNYGRTQCSSIAKDFEQKLIECLVRFNSGKIDFKTICTSISEILHQLKVNCENDDSLQDDRILKTLEFLDTNFEKVYSLEEISAHSFLSPSRFLHLFKEKTGLNFRRYQLWNKIVKSLPYLTKNSITDTAYTFGFSDNSHYTRSFIETFGVSPKFFLKRE